jgi:hypothetical protein
MVEVDILGMQGLPEDQEIVVVVPSGTKRAQSKRVPNNKIR